MHGYGGWVSPLQPMDLVGVNTNCIIEEVYNASSDLMLTWFQWKYYKFFNTFKIVFSEKYKDFKTLFLLLDLQ